MSMQTWQETLINAQLDGTAVTGTAAGSLLPAQALYTLPANFIDVVGKKVRVRAAGRISNIATTPGTLTLNLKFGATNVFTSQAIALNTTAKTNVTWIFEATLDARAIGSAAALLGIGYLQSESVVGAAAGVANQVNVPASAPANGTTFDSRVSQQVDLTATFSLTGNSIQLHQYALESLN